MAETLKWILQLKNELSPAAAAGAASLVQLQIELKQTARELTALEKASHGLNVGKGILGALSGGLSFVGDIAGGLFDAAASFGKMALSGISFREDTSVAFKQLLGTAEAADALFENSLRVAKLTKFETRDVVNLYTELLGAQFKQGDLNTIVAGLSDLGTARGPEKMAQLEHALMKVQSQGKLTADALGEITLSGVSRTKINEQLGKALGIKETDSKKLSDKVAAALKKGTVDATTGVGAVMDALREMFDKGGVLGDFAKAQSETLSGVWSNFKEAFSNLFMSKSTQELPAIAQLKKSMLLVSGFFDTSPAKGKQVLAVVNRLVEDLLGLFKLDPGNAEAAFDKMLGWLESFEAGVKRVTTWIGDELFPAISNAFNQDGGFLATITRVLVQAMRVAGGAFAEGLAEALGIGDLIQHRKATKAPRYKAPDIDSGDRVRSGDAPPLAASVDQANRGEPLVLGPAKPRPMETKTGGGATTINLSAPITVTAADGTDAGQQIADQLHRQLGALNRAPSRAER